MLVKLYYCTDDKWVGAQHRVEYEGREGEREERENHHCSIMAHIVPYDSQSFTLKGVRISNTAEWHIKLTHDNFFLKFFNSTDCPTVKTTNMPLMQVMQMQAVSYQVLVFHLPVRQTPPILLVRGVRENKTIKCSSVHLMCIAANHKNNFQKVLSSYYNAKLACYSGGKRSFLSQKLFIF